MATGFSNEKSAEYVVINDLYCKIKDKCALFYPIIYQSKRDDTMISSQNNIDDLGLLICFARRPKVNSLYDEIIEITFRETLFKHANYFYNKGVDSIIGIPIGSRIEEIGFGAKCKWLVPEKNGDGKFSCCLVDKSSLKCIMESDNVNELKEGAIIDIMRRAKKWSWNEILELLKNWYWQERQEAFTSFGFWVRGQRPIFVVYKLK